MAADANRLAAALAYEDDRKRRLAESIPTLTGPTTAPRRSVRTDLENLSAGLGQGITTQLEGIKGLITDPVGTAKGAYEAARAVVRDPSVLAAALSQMGQKAMSGPLGAGEVIGEMIGPRKTGPVMAELDVYHGTPHRFPATEANPLGEFDASKIGTGEGAQAYGHGVYLAENPGVARSYIKTPEDWAVQANVKGSAYRKAQAEMTKIERELRQKNNANIPKDEISAFMYAEKNADKFDSKLMERIRAVRQAEEKAYKDFSAGSFYKADLPDEMIDRMLDWDKPLKNQSKAVKQAIASNPQLAQFMEKGNREMTGAEFHNWAQDQVTPPPGDWGFLKTDIELSRLLKEAGIPGIKYKDAGSRGQGGSGTRNFVVFPGEEKKVRILERK